MVLVGDTIKVNRKIGKVVDISQLRNDARYVITYERNDGTIFTFIEGNIDFEIIKGR